MIFTYRSMTLCYLNRVDNKHTSKRTCMQRFCMLPILIVLYRVGHKNSKEVKFVYEVESLKIFTLLKILNTLEGIKFDLLPSCWSPKRNQLVISLVRNQTTCYFVGDEKNNLLFRYRRNKQLVISFWKKRLHAVF